MLHFTKNNVTSHYKHHKYLKALIDIFEEDLVQDTNTNHNEQAISFPTRKLANINITSRLLSLYNNKDNTSRNDGYENIECADSSGDG